jgi:hypothetical protein
MPFERTDGDADARRGARLKSKTLCGAGVRGVWILVEHVVVESGVSARSPPRVLTATAAM